MTAIPGASFTEPATAADAWAGDMRGITLDRPRVIVDVNLLLRDGDSILLGLRRAGFAAGMYSPPAGHLELGESVRDALIRETREEIGITITPGDARFVQVMHDAYGIGRMAFFFEARTWTGNITNREPDKCGELRWFPLGALPEALMVCRPARCRSCRPSADRSCGGATAGRPAVAWLSGDGVPGVRGARCRASLRC
jgi:8-oxo-dGTP diphosphatase